jgi:hypothetical protein
MTGNLLEDCDEKLPSQLLISAYRRRQLLKGMFSARPEEKKEGQKVIRAFQQELVHTQDPNKFETLDEN